jgi:hypothetical protein
MLNVLIFMKKYIGRFVILLTLILTTSQSHSISPFKYFGDYLAGIDLEEKADDITENAWKKLEGTDYEAACRLVGYRTAYRFLSSERWFSNTLLVGGGSVYYFSFKKIGKVRELPFIIGLCMCFAGAFIKVQDPRYPSITKATYSAMKKRQQELVLQSHNLK